MCTSETHRQTHTKVPHMSLRPHYLDTHTKARQQLYNQLIKTYGEQKRDIKTVFVVPQCLDHLTLSHLEEHH